MYVILLYTHINFHLKIAKKLELFQICWKSQNSEFQMYSKSEMQCNVFSLGWDSE